MLAGAIEGFRLSEQQRRVWSLAERGATAYFAQGAVLLEGELDERALEEALQRVVQRHEILRTSFHHVSHRVLPVQSPRDGVAVALARHVLEGRDLAEEVAAYLRWERADTEDEADLFRVGLLSIAEDRHVLTFTLPALCADARTLELLVHELGACYAACLGAGEPAGVPIQYADFAEWQGEWLEGEDARTGLDYWRRDCFDALAWKLPLESAMLSRVESFEPVSLELELDASILSRIAALQIPEPTFFLACWGALLGRLSGCPGFAIGTLFDGRTYEELEGALGLFARYVPVSFRWAADQIFREATGQIAVELEGARIWQDYFGWREADDFRGAAMPPYLGVAFEHGALDGGPVQAGPLRLSLWQRSVCGDRFDLKLGVWRQGGALRAELSYAAGLFSQDDIEQIRDGILTLVDHALRNPGERLGDLEILGREAKRRLSGALNGTACEIPSFCLHEWVEEQAGRAPEAIALVLGDRRLTYAELSRRANRLAHLLRDLGIAPEERVAILLDRSFEMVIAQLAILKAGAAFVVLQPDHPEPRLACILQDAEARLVLTETPFLTRLPAGRCRTVCFDRDAAMLAEQASSSPEPVALQESLAYIAYTSGSTGAPKGVMAHHRGVVSYLSYLIGTYHLRASDVALQIAAPSFDAMVREIFGPLAVGGTVVLPASERAKSPRALVEEIRQQRVTLLLSIVPTFLRELLDAASEAPPEGCSVRLLLASGEVLFAADAMKARQVFGRDLLVVNQYGPTECTMTSSFHPVRENDAARPALSIGRPICNAGFHLLDPRLQAVPPGAAGEIFIAGPGLARGYLGLPRTTSERFLPDPFGGRPGGRLYRTGDLARLLSDGTLEFLGRRDRQVKIRGIRVEPEEVEAVLAEHPAVRQAAAQLRDDGAGAPRLIAYLVCQGEPPTLRELRIWLGSRLPEAMVPSGFVFLDALPRSSTGKVDLAALPAVAQAMSGEPKAPRTPAEELLVGIWAEVLGLEEVGRNDDFFDLGGHSLLATRAMARVCAAFQVELPLRTVFEAPTVEAMAQVVNAAREGGLSPGIPSMDRSASGQPAPLSFAQERLWFLDQLDPGAPTYNLPSALWLRGDLDPVRLEGAFRQTLRRHEVLRTRFPILDAEPFQVVEPVPAWSLALVDLGGLPPDRRETELRLLAAREAVRPFDLQAGPLLRSFLASVAPYEHLLFVNMHHIVSDDWSLGILTREIAVLYEAPADARSIPLPELPVQYADFARWQRRWLSAEVLAAQLAYWQRRLGGVSPSFGLPYDRPRPVVRRYGGARLGMPLPAPLSAAVRRMGRQQGATLFMALCAGFQILLSRYSGQTDQSIGTAVSGRSRLQTEGLIGCFADTLVLRVDLTGDPSFAELLERVREICLEAYAYQDLPFEKLVEELNPDRSLQHNPLFQVMLVLQSRTTAGASLSSVDVQSFELQRRTAKFDLEMLVVESTGLHVQLEYDTDLFDAPTIHRLLGHFQRVLEGGVEEPGRRLSAMPVLGEAERHQILIEWSRQDPAASGGLVFLRLFELQVREGPDSIAVFEGEEWLTYAQLNRCANRLARELVRRGAGADCVVALLMERGIDFLVSVLAVFKAGGAYLPLDPQHPPQRHALILERSGACLLLASRRSSGASAEALACAAGTATQPLCFEEVHALHSSDDDLSTPGDPDHLAYVIYTSGSTGVPKGAMLTHRGMLNHLEAKIEDLGLTARDIVAQNASQCFDISVWQLLAALLVGGRVQVLGDREAHDPARLLSQVRDGGTSVLEVVPSFLRFLLDEIAAQDLRGPDLPALRWLIPTGEALPPQLCHAWWSRFPDIRLLNAYGPTECSDDVSHAPLDPGSLGGAVRAPIGRGVLGTRLHVLDSGCRLLPIGGLGELYVGGLGVGRGYLGDGGRTAERFVPDPFAKWPGARLYRTGDLARLLPDGRLDFMGRSDHQVKVRGFRIELEEIEAVLAGHPAASQAVVLARESTTPDGLQLVAYVVGDAPVADLRRFLEERLPEYMVPVAFVRLDSLPLTPNGKLDRRALPAPALAGPPWSSRPLTPVEEMVAGIWGEVLERDGIGPNDGFFDLGGHSLLATRVASRLRHALGVEIPLRRLFEIPTLAELAAEIEGEMRQGRRLSAPPLVSSRRDGPPPLSFAQQRLWFIDQLEPGNPVYNVFSAVRFLDPVRHDLLQASLEEVVRRHESLRTTFSLCDSEPVQVVHSWLAPEIACIDLSALVPAARAHELRVLAADELLRPFDLGNGPLVRVRLVTLGRGESAALLAMHHIVSDEWSMGLLVEELCAAYAALSRSEAPALPKLPVQYADYAVWQRGWLQGDVLAAELAYWRRHLAGAPELLALPADRPRPSVQSFRGTSSWQVLPEALVSDLRSAGRSRSVTLFMLFLTAFQVLLGRAAGESEIVIGSPIAGRNRLETERLIGFFVNTLALRASLAGRPSLGTLLERTRETVLAAYAHQELPFELLVEELNPQRSLGHTPLFQVMMNLVNAPQRPDLPGLSMAPLVEGQQSAIATPFDLTLSISDTSAWTRLAFEYSTDLFDASTVERLHGYLRQVLETLATAPETDLSEVVLWSPAERHQVLIEWNDTVAPVSGQGLYGLFEVQARKRPGAPAVLFDDGFDGGSWSFAELEGRVDRLVCRLRDLGVGPEQVVGLLADGGPELALGMLGVLKAGGAFLPLDRGWPVSRRAALLQDAGARVLLGCWSEEPVEGVPAGCAVLRLDRQEAWEGDSPPATVVPPEQAAYVIYTSGSTGRPKGVVVGHGAAVSFAVEVAERCGLGGEDRFLQFASPGFDVLIEEVFPVWSRGGAVVFALQEELLAPTGLEGVLKRQGVTGLELPTPYWNEWMDDLERRGEAPPGSLRLLLLGCEKPSLARLSRWGRYGVPVVHVFGLTETAVTSTVHCWDGTEPPDRELPIGRPVGNTWLRVLDPEGAPVPRGAVGELYIGGVGVARGYLGRPDLTAERFVPVSFVAEPGLRAYRTGDLARYRADGALDFLGRIDEQMKVRGFRVEPGEVAMLLEQHPAVSEAFVAVREVPRGDRRLVAWVVLAPGSSASREALFSYIAACLPEYMVPAEIVDLPALPRTSNGKIDRAALPVPEWGKQGGRSEAPRTPIEELLAEIWCEVLGREAVGRDEDFFALGGHSLLAVQVVSRVRQTLGVELPLRSLFEGATVAALGRVLRQGLQQDVSAPPLIPVPRSLAGTSLPLSFAQQRLWFLDRFEPSRSTYNIAQAIRLSGRLRPEVLERTLGEIVRRHEVLRTRFGEVQGHPVQEISPPAPVPLPLADLDGLERSRREAEVRRLAREEASRPFDLARGPLLRLTLLRSSDDEHVALLTVHHIVFDGWSQALFQSEVAALYSAFQEDLPSPLPELPIQYADFAQWQRSWLAEGVLESQLAYWRRQLEPVRAIDLPTDRPRPAVQTSRGSSLPVLVPASVTEGLRRVGRHARTTLFMTVLTAYQLLLDRYAGQSDVRVGTPVANRGRTELEPLIGLFVNTLVMRSDLSGNPTLGELLAQVRETVVGASIHQDIPFEQLVEAIQPERDPSRNPLFQVMLVLEALERQSTEIHGLTFTSLQLEADSAKFDLTLFLFETLEGLAGSIEYNSDLFDATTVARMRVHFGHLLAGLALHLEARIGELPLLPESDRWQMLAEWNDTASDMSGETSIPSLFVAQAELAPDARAVVFEDESLSYGEVAARSERLARHLRQLGIGSGSFVGIYLDRSAEMVPALLGVLRAGAAYVPLEATFPVQRLRWILTSLGVSCVITQPSRLETIEALAGEMPALRDAVLPGVPEWRQESSRLRIWPLAHAGEPLAGPPLTRVTGVDTAYVIFTSGSTGMPKGVVVRHGPVVNLLSWATRTFGFGPSDRVLFVTALGFDLSVFDVFGLLSAGGSVRVASERDLQEPERLVGLLREDGITFWDSAPAALQQLVPFFPASPSDGGGSLRLVFLSGDWIPVWLPDRVREVFSQAQVVSLGGATEATVWSNYFPVGEVPAQWTSIPYGRPIRNARYHVLDRSLGPCPVGAAGDLYIAGDCLASAYARDPAQTAEKFLPDPFAPELGARMYGTGDRARYRPDGNLQFLGRLDDQVKIRGFRIELGEISMVLAQHPGVRDNAVVVREDAPGERRLVAYFVPDAGCSPDEADLRGHLRERLPEHMIPAAWVELAALPVTANGKLDRQALPRPVRSAPGPAESLAVPRSPVEELVASIWCEVLGVERVGAEDDFFELGGHSLLATQVVSRLRGTFGIEVPLRVLFEAPTLAQLGERVAHARRGNAAFQPPPLRPVPRGEGMPLSFAQQRYWFQQQLEPDSPMLNIPTAARLEGRLDTLALLRALSEISRRHESLRTTFVVADGVPLQVVGPPRPVPLPLVDLSGLEESARWAEGRRLVDGETRWVFRLERGPLLRALLVRLAAHEHLVTATMHHIVSDGWSMELFLREVGVLYEAFSAGRPSPLPELPIQYGDFAAWQRQWLQGEGLEIELGYWRRRLEEAPALLELPTDRPRSQAPVPVSESSFCSFALPPSLREGLMRLSRKQRATLFMTLLVGFEALLFRWTGQEDLCIGTPIAGRNHMETENLIGAFVNTLVLRSDLSGELSFDRLVERIRATALDAHAHQELPFGKLVEELRPERSLSHTPIFQVLFLLQNVPQQEIRLRDLRLSALGTDLEGGGFDIALSLQEWGAGLAGTFRYRSDLFDRTTLVRMALQLEILLAAAVSDPAQALSRLPLLTVQELQQLVVEWNDTATPAPAICLHELFEAQVERTPGEVALIFEGETVSYRQLDRWSNQLARHLRRGGVAPGDVVPIVSERSIGMVAMVLGVLKAGAAYVALDPRHPKARLAHVLEESGAHLLLAQEGVLDRLPEFSGRIVCPERDRALLENEEAVSLGRSAGPEDLAYVVYTSGSTGMPKGILVSHGSAVGYLSWVTRAHGIGAGDTALQLAGLSFDASVRDLLGPLSVGASIVIVPSDVARDPAALLVRIAQNRVTCLPSIVPSLLQQITDAAVLGGRVYDSVRLVLVSGEPLYVADCRRAEKAFGEEVRLVNQYGPTECTMTSTFQRVAGPREEGGVMSIGRPIARAGVHVLDPCFQPVGIGLAGEICIAGPGLAFGYLGQPDRTAEVFVPHPFALQPGDRIYRTGDLARRRADGSLELLGRRDHQIKLRGLRVEPGEIEAVLRGHPGVRQAVVVPRGDGAERGLAGYVVPSGEAPVPSALRGYLQERLPDYLVPAILVVLQELPLTPNGKVDRKALPEPVTVAPDVPVEAIDAPRSETEEELAAIWSSLLRKPVGIHDNFFELGGHSLLAIQVVHRLQKGFGVEISLQAIFEEPTVASLARRIEAERGQGPVGDEDTIPSVPRTAPHYPASFAQQRLWYLHQLEPGSPVYNLYEAVRLTGNLAVPLLAESLHRVVDRHESLRTRFVAEDGLPAQVIVPEIAYVTPLVDLASLPEGKRRGEVERLTRDEVRSPFDLSRAPLLRTTLLRLAERDHALLFTIHHIVSDRWSIGVLLREVVAFYRASVEKRSAPLPELPIQYLDLASWQRQRLQGAALESQLAYWRRRLAGVPELRLPLDRPRPDHGGSAGDRLAFSVPEPVARSLRALADQESASLFLTLLAAYQTFLGRSAGQDDVVVGIDIANRSRAETEGLIGFLVNQLAIRSDLGGNPTFRELLRRVRQAALNDYAHQDLPFQDLVAALYPRRERDPVKNPVFQVMFSLDPGGERIAGPSGLSLSLLSAENSTARFELTLRMSENERGLAGELEYRTDLFDARTVQRMVRRFATLLQSIATDPDVRLDALSWLDPNEKEERVMEQQARQKVSLDRFKKIQPKAVALPENGLVKMDTLIPGSPLPLVIQPAVDDVDLAGWAAANKELIETKLLRHGGILFRGFGIDTAEKFERFASSVCSDLFNENGEHPRESVSGNVYTPVFYPPEEQLLWHNENSFNFSWPSKIFFCCVRPADTGGETPIVDSRKMHELIDPEIRELFESKQVMYLRNYGDGLGLRWQTVFGTEDKQAIEERCAKGEIHLEWKDGDRLRTRSIRPGVIRHPETGEASWFNQGQHWHVSCLNAATRESLLALFAEEDLPRHFYFGDGTPIDDSIMAKILELYRKLEVSFPWQKGDVMLLDNILTAHGRNPFVGERKLLVSLGDMKTYRDVRPS